MSTAEGIIQSIDYAASPTTPGGLAEIAEKARAALSEDGRASGTPGHPARIAVPAVRHILREIEDAATLPTGASPRERAWAYDRVRRLVLVALDEIRQWEQRRGRVHASREEAGS